MSKNVAAVGREGGRDDVWCLMIRMPALGCGEAGMGGSGEEGEENEKVFAAERSWAEAKGEH